MATFVLIHGSFHGGWCWDDVSKRLRSKGHQVIAPTFAWARKNSSQETLSPYIEEVRASAEAADSEPMIFVGHSFAGMLLAPAAKSCPKLVSTCIYLDAFVPKEGECAFDLLGDMGIVLRGEAEQNAGMIPTPPASVFGLSGRKAASVATKLRPMPAATHKAPAPISASDSYPWRSIYVRCAKFPGFESQERRARNAGWPIHSLRTGHDAMMLAPRRVTALLNAAARDLRG